MSGTGGSILAALSTGTLIVFPGWLRAQETVAPPDTGRARVERVISNPALGGPLATARPDTRLLVTEEEKTLEMSLSSDLGRDVHSGIQYRLGIQGTAPLTDGTEETVFGSLAGLATGTTVKMTLSLLSWDGRIDEDAVQEWCEMSKDEGRLPESLDCGSYQEADIPEELEDEHRDVTNYTGPWSVSLGVEIGRSGLDHLDSATLAQVERSETAWSLTGAVGGFLEGGLATVEGSFTRAYKPAEKKEVCSPIGEDGALTCSTAPFGAPTEVEGWVLDAAYRRFLGSSFGYALQSRYRLADDEYGVELPLYFAPDEGGSLVGGLGPAWDSDDGWSVELFVGVALSFDLP